MDEIKRVLVAVDLTEMDETLVQYITMVSNQLSLDKIYFINVLKNFELPDEIVEKYPDMVAPQDEACKKEIQYTIDKVAGNQLNTEYEIKVVEGNTAEQVLKWAKIKEIDWIVVGRKSGLEGQGIITGKVVKLAPCSVVFIPEVLPPIPSKIVVPLDYSDASKLAFEFSLNLASNIPSLSMTCLNIYSVPTGYHTTGKSFEEFDEIMKNNSKKTFQKFVEGYDTKDITIDAKFELDKRDSISKKIYQFAVKEQANTIVIGSKGRTQAAAILLGSIAEKLIQLNTQLPLIVVKQRRHNMDFLEALMKL